MPRVLLEVAIETVEDALAAERGGADRLELCSALDLGGLTPTVGMLLQIRAAVRLPVLVMLRPRAGDFVYSPTELDVMSRDLELFLPHQPDGFVFGPLNVDGRVNSEAAGKLRQQCGTRQAVFHRAFDRTPKHADALDELIRLNFTRVLTSGREQTATEGIKKIKAAVEHAGDRIEVLPCGKVRAENAVTVLEATGCTQLHGSFAEPVPDSDERGHRGYVGRSRTGEGAVAAARSAVDQWAGLGTSASG
jgi:copper homeostasis protein